MGACASVSKSMKAEAIETAPEPEQIKEETPVVAAEEKKAVEDGDNSLGTLLVEGEAPKEAAKEESVEESKPAEEKSDETPPPVTEAAAVPEEEKKTEEAAKK